MTRIIDCTMTVSNKIWRPGWKVDISTNRRPVERWKGTYPTKSMAEGMVKKKVKAVGYDCPNE
jgi:kynurenine formamidase